MAASLFIPPSKALDANANPYAGAKWFFYATGTTTPQSVYTTFAMGTAHANPVVADSTGKFANIFFDPTLVYRGVLKDSTEAVTLHDIDPISSSTLAALAASGGSALVGFLQAGTGAVTEALQTWARRVGVYPEQFRAPADVDDTQSFVRMFALSGHVRNYILTNDYVLSSTVSVPSGVTIDGMGIGKVTVSTANVTAFNVQNKTKVKIVNLEIVSTVAGVSASVAGITVDNSSYVVIDKCVITGFQWAGVYLATASYFQVTGCTFGTMLGTVPDASDIHAYFDSNNGLIADNFCFGGRTVGINIQDPGGAGTYLPRQIVVRNNVIGAHSVFGINVYIGSPVGTVRNSDIILDGNFVEGITGTANTSNGMGIYCVGNGLGGLRVVNNRVKNCCIDTLDRTNGPAGITLSGFGQSAGLTGTAVAPIIEGNNVDGMTQGDGILVVSSYNGATVGPNNATLASTNNGTGPGGATVLGQALRIHHSNNVNVTGGLYTNNGTSDAIFVFASSANNTDVSLSNVQIKTATGYGLRVSRNSSFTLSRLNVNGLTGVSGGGAMSLDSIDSSVVQGVSISSSASYAAEIYRAANSAFLGCRFSGTNALLAQFACTGSRMDKTCVLTGIVENAATGLIIERYGTAAPATGAGAVGDTVINSVPTVGQPKEWKCTTAAYPGTWVSTGNL